MHFMMTNKNIIAENKLMSTTVDLINDKYR